MKFIIKLLSTIGFIGYIPFASGTFGSLVGAVIWIFTSSWKFYPLVVFSVVVIGIFTSDYAEKKIFFRKDPSEIVIDELSGMTISYLFFNFTFDVKSLFFLILGFAIFRFFDILKPQPIKIIQRLPGGFGIMADDILAGGLTCLIMNLIRFIFNL